MSLTLSRSRRSLPLALTVLGIGGPFLRVTAAEAATTYRATSSEQWGSVTVTASTSRKRLTGLAASSTYHTQRSLQLDNEALPILRREALAAHSANIHTVSGATITSEAFIAALRADLKKAGA